MRIRTFISAVLLVPSIALAHGGGLDKNGCHTNRKTGEYHCHGGGLSPSPEPRGTPRGATSFAEVPTNTDSRDDRALIKTAQTLLRAIGYTPGESGTLDETTRIAIRSFQAVEGLEKNGSVTPILLLRLAQAASRKCGAQH